MSKTLTVKHVPTGTFTNSLFSAYVFQQKSMSVKMKYSKFRLTVADQLWRDKQWPHIRRERATGDTPMKLQGAN
jgi:hypothetical protein